ncbi:MAG: NAD(P)-dependent oxidoreductase [Thermoleophilia bacterium]|nr:NAD(P)-dependent oxidoreductase [Thermoleophilia bacterium]
MRVLVTGASGFVGSHLAPALADAGHEVLAVVRRPGSAPAGATEVAADLARDRLELPAADAVVHLAQANTRFPDGAAELYAVNTAATQRLLDHARRTGARRFVLASTGSVYGFADPPLSEDDPVRADDFYALTKIHAEALVAAYRGFFATAVLRLFVPYGPGQEGRMIPALAARVREGRPVTLNGGGRPRSNPVYVGDVVRVVAAALERDEHVLVNVAGDEVVGVGELAERMGAVLGRRPLLEQGAPDAPGDIVADTGRLHALFALRPLVGLDEGLRRTLGAPVVTA